MTGTALWLVALAALSLVAAIVLRRVAALAGDTRGLQQLQQDLAGVERRLATVVEPLVARLDEVRRGARDPAELAPELDAARTALRALAKEARTIQPPGALAERVQQLVWELDRAVRAADMAGHGVTTLGDIRNRSIGSTEAQVALKRGTLGLRHAREAVGTIVATMSSLSPADLHAMASAASSGRVGGAIITPGLDEDLLTGKEEPPRS